MPKYWNSETQMCDSCSVENCLLCEGITSCKKCADNYIMSMDNKCLMCPEGCDDCYENEYGMATCDECEEGYIYNKFLMQCEKIRCDMQGTYMVEWVEETVTSGVRSFDIMRSCMLCGDGCRECDEEGMCLSCLDSQDLYLDEQMGKCVPLCKGSPFDWEKLECVQCGYKCDVCTDDMHCLSCSDGYFLKQEDDYSYCGECSPFCEVCIERDEQLTKKLKKL